MFFDNFIVGKIHFKWQRFLLRIQLNQLNSSLILYRTGYNPNTGPMRGYFSLPLDACTFSFSFNSKKKFPIN